jgi:hypothetical protein
MSERSKTAPGARAEFRATRAPARRLLLQAGVRVLAFLLVLAPISAWAAAAPAQPIERTPRDVLSEKPALELKRDVEVMLQGAFGFGGNVDDSNVNRYGPGVGARAGVTLKAPRMYVGGSFVRFFGAEDQTGKYYTTTADLHLGYDFRVLDERLLIRPELAGGVAQAVLIQSDNAGYPLTGHLAPGVLVGLRMKPVLAFAQLRYDTVPGEWSNSFTLLVGAGGLF